MVGHMKPEQNISQGQILSVMQATWEDWREDWMRPEDLVPANLNHCWNIGDSGYLMFVPMNRTTMQLHIAALPGTRGVTRRAIEVMAYYRSLGIVRFVGLTPSYCRGALVSAYRAGFRRCGKISNAILRDGIPYDLILSEA